MKRHDLVALLAGIVFALGLGISGMTRPAKVIAFLDVAGAWDPGLGFVMVGAIGVHVLFARPAADAKPWFAPAFVRPSTSAIDARLLGGAALFGIGWGLAGFCPGPAIASVVTGDPGVLTFVVAMLVGMAAHALWRERGPSSLTRSRALSSDATASRD